MKVAVVDIKAQLQPLIRMACAKGTEDVTIIRVTAEDEKEDIPLEDDLAARLQAPAKTPKPSIDPENRPAQQPREAARTDKVSMTGVGPPYQQTQILSMSGHCTAVHCLHASSLFGCCRAKLPL